MVPSNRCHEADRWVNPNSTRLLVIFPGASGIGLTPGYRSIAGWFWLQGYTVLLCLPPGSSGEPGEYDMMRWLSRSADSIAILKSSIRIERIYAIGACAGGAVAAHLLKHELFSRLGGRAIALFETPLRWCESHLSEFQAHAAEAGIVPSTRCLIDVLHLADAIEHIPRCLFCHGGDLRMPFTTDDLRSIRRDMQAGNIVVIDHASHGLLKRGPISSLLSFCETANRHFQTNDC